MMVNIKSIHNLLAENDFFKGMSSEYLKTLAGCGKLAHFKGGDFLIREGDCANAFYLIRSGKVAIECHTPASGEVSIARIGAGDITGYSWLFPPYRNNFDSLALSDVSAVVLNGKCLRSKAEQDHELGYQLMKRFAQVMHDRLEATRHQMLDVYANGRTSNAG